MRRFGVWAALVALLCQLAASPGSTGPTVLALTAAVAVIALAALRWGSVSAQRHLPVRARPGAVDAPAATRQYEPAVAGRPQPRAPGCGR